MVPDDFTLSDKNIGEVQQRLPNRNGMTTDHALWPGKELGGKPRPDVTAKACMKDCAAEPKVASLLPDFARNAHGNLAEQNRMVGPQRGADTASRQPAGALRPPRRSPASSRQPRARSRRWRMARPSRRSRSKNNCTACHAVDNKIVGPSWRDIAKKYAGKADYLAGKIRSGGSGVWGAIPMPPQTLSDSEARRIAELAGRRRRTVRAQGYPDSGMSQDTSFPFVY